MNRLSDDQMAARLAQDIPDGAYVNLGIGLPNLVAAFVPKGREVMYQTENGLLGVGPSPAPGQEDPELIDASKKFVTTLPGASFFDHTDSFAMMRGGHLDIAVLGAYQVAENGDLANWATLDESFPPAVGGAMDLVAGVPQIFAIMRHTTREGSPKLLRRCSFPLTGAGVVTRVYTDLGVFAVTPEGFRVIDLAPGNSLGDVQSVTEARLIA
ncbi:MULTISPECIES: 3-oxoacid CoA-transferase subunit B [unclassified Paracoccus (in: a-proteobacteria)]|uniref:3-oxoacid CoA-transferase subunit B n=1 Tax=unclassified Paracoccus (in: a-proteobacteria) TaxID=2688777 RepID=UPI00160397F5|nr:MULTISPECIES: 3-oxoacid CoA-transferase subunit B [unclassified Paracoccus (in: a-proteobacteria)]MBB1492855.1 3-oxoacid CoA-transferase subunit B [Paracoccus sp. MC1854]MBB1499504.1 3-oxoacid CoA-transferase subunit B [Paracoccus sp. MC1862]QQO45816.1 3-oxoacid CoA-transferase subunit B [Paracoccus sp. MC1862]